MNVRHNVQQFTCFLLTGAGAINGESSEFKLTVQPDRLYQRNITCVGSENSLVDCAVSDQLLADCSNTLNNAYISCQGVYYLSYSCHDDMVFVAPLSQI